VGHVTVAETVADALGLDRVLWVPARQSPHKDEQAVTAAETRLDMVRAAAAGDPRFAVETLELERRGPSYTVDTLRELRRRLPDAELFLILGADQVRSFATWRDPAEIAALARLVVFDREGSSATAAAHALPASAKAEFVSVPRVDTSSTDVRKRVGAGLAIDSLVPPGVRAIIERERLYSAT
jgi:nicotinate-nucleotide adenylyltransferase